MEKPQNIPIGDSYEQLIAELETLSTFEAAKDWGNRAKIEIERIAGLLRAADLEIVREAQELEKTKFENSKKSLVGKLFNSGPSSEEQVLSERIAAHRQRKADIALASEFLQRQMDFTPISPDQQKKLLQELRLRKREVQEKKREITMVMRPANTAPNPLDAAFDPETMRRRKAHYAKDAIVQPHETMAEAMNRQIAQIDVELQWVERFHL